MELSDFKKLKLPHKSGVYQFIGTGGKILYVGKATFLRERVRSYFDPDLSETRGKHMVNMVKAAKTIRYIVTESALEALLLEAALIKKHHPIYNSRDKDDKSFNYVVMTKEDFPRVLIVRGRELFDPAKKFDFKIATMYGPFPNGGDLREAMRIIRKIFPFRDTCTPAHYISKKEISGAGVPGQGKPCFNRQIGLCPGVCIGEISATEYRKTVRRIGLLFQGKKRQLLGALKKDMKKASQEQRFEEAQKIKRTIFGLEHIQDVALIKEDKLRTLRDFRIEGYDIAHIGGAASVGVMTVIENGEPDKPSYRKFKIKTFTGADDTRALAEVLERRLNHPEWKLPRLFVIDGGKAQKKTAEKVLADAGIAIPVVSVVKDEHHKAREVLGEKRIVSTHEASILLANTEAHRFAISYHRNVRGKRSLGE